MRDEEEEEEEELNQKAVLEQVFGHSSDDEDDNDDEMFDSDSDCDIAYKLEQVFGPSSDEDDGSGDRSDSDSDYDNFYNLDKTYNCEWECISEVKGLWMLRNFLSISQQSRLLSSIESEKWFTEPSINQAMRFGFKNLPYWAISLSFSIRHCSSFSKYQLPPNLMQREPIFDQMITNVYQPGEGICPHIDLLRFEDAIAIVSLESSCVMHFTTETQRVPVLLTPGSLILMFGDARYVWKHEINRKPGFQMWNGELLNQSKRTSITLRKLSPSPSS
ncbi:uncharacterized protein P8A3.02c [Cicer arietinum]|uniref:Uncharacterized protein P8A3.02c n=1 Tax=Cicer arietinum TaxID=3827 RepID=A0A1S3DYX0_CICAR|nr:uncharacterized protein P8A3.02c [Cicer arietinum]